MLAACRFGFHSGKGLSSRMKIERTLAAGDQIAQFPLDVTVLGDTKESPERESNA